MGRKLRAIDLYSGVGGWSLGLRLAGIDVVASYERWGPANETNFKNNSHQAQTVDIRHLALSDLPTDIDIVVGSPPCTQFSYSNRGGSGDIVDGLKDIKRFLTIVNYLKPRVWAMENVPRVAGILQRELEDGGVLQEFQHLGCQAHIVDMAQYGVPQRRQRCLAGNFDIETLRSYVKHATAHTLGDIVAALSKDPVVDPIFGISISSSVLRDHIPEDPLSLEEVRINSANKTSHTVYNFMPFPDSLERPVRTITATCTRVSRESVVIEVPSGSDRAFRRLTLRERASLQSFPVTYQFYGSNFGQKLRMIGNAIPPAFSYLLGHAMQGHNASKVPDIRSTSKSIVCPEPMPLETPPDRVGARYPSHRTFKFAIPSLQLKSGVRFELRNETIEGHTAWRIAFFFGTSKIIKEVLLSSSLGKRLAAQMSKNLLKSVTPALDEVCKEISLADIGNLQAVWAHKGPGGTRPFIVLDTLSAAGATLVDRIEPFGTEARYLIDIALDAEFGEGVSLLPGVAKLHRNAALIVSGLLLGSAINPLLTSLERSRKPRRKSVAVA